jgi:hypothetical protein
MVERVIPSIDVCIVRVRIRTSWPRFMGDTTNFLDREGGGPFNQLNTVIWKRKPPSTHLFQSALTITSTSVLFFLL